MLRGSLTSVLVIAGMAVNLIAGLLIGWLLLRRSTGQRFRGLASAVEEVCSRLDRLIVNLGARSERFDAELDRVKTQLERVAQGMEGRVGESLDGLTKQSAEFRTALSDARHQLREEQGRLQGLARETSAPAAETAAETATAAGASADLTPNEQPIVKTDGGEVTQIVQSFQEMQVQRAKEQRERRRHVRYCSPVPLVVTPLDDFGQEAGSPFDAMLRDISLGGLSFQHTRPAPCRLLRVKLLLPEGTKQVVLEVIRCEAIGRFYFVGGRFHLSGG